MVQKFEDFNPYLAHYAHKTDVGVPDADKIEDAIERAKVEINHARKKDNEGLADKIAARLKDKLEEFGYNWKRDPYALEILGDYVTEDVNESVSLTEMDKINEGYMRNLLPKMVEVSNNSRLTQDVCRMFEEKFDDRELRDIMQWLQLIDSKSAFGGTKIKW